MRRRASTCQGGCAAPQASTPARAGRAGGGKRLTRPRGGGIVARWSRQVARHRRAASRDPEKDEHESPTCDRCDPQREGCRSCCLPVLPGIESCSIAGIRPSSPARRTALNLSEASAAHQGRRIGVCACWTGRAARTPSPAWRRPTGRRAAAHPPSGRCGAVSAWRPSSIRSPATVGTKWAEPSTSRSHPEMMRRPSHTAQRSTHPVLETPGIWARTRWTKAGQATGQP